jgi:hypothetical protein
VRKFASAEVLVQIKVAVPFSTVVAASPPPLSGMCVACPSGFSTPNSFPSAGHRQVGRLHLLPDGRATCLGGGAGLLSYFLGGGISLVASAHLLAAAGGAGLLEVDVNPNPLRNAFDAAYVAGQTAAFAILAGLMHRPPWRWRTTPAGANA